MTENNRNRFIMPDLGTETDVTLIDTVTGETYEDNFEDVVAKLNEINNELMIYKSKEYALKESHFTKMGGFTMQRDGRGRYNLLSENVIPKNSAVIRIASPDTIWNKMVVDLLQDILTEEA